MINAGKRYEVNNCRFGYLPNRIVFYLMNLHIKSRKTYFARSGISHEDTSYKADSVLSEEGVQFSQRLADALLAHREQEHQQFIEQGGSESEIRSLTVWTSTRRRTAQTTKPLRAMGFAIQEKTQLSQLNPGDSEKLSEGDLRKAFPDHWEEHQEDPYHHRYPRGEVTLPPCRLPFCFPVASSLFRSPWLTVAVAAAVELPRSCRADGAHHPGA